MPGVGQYCSQWEKGYRVNGDFSVYITNLGGFGVHVVDWTTYWQKWGGDVQNNVLFQIDNICGNDPLVSTGGGGYYDARICPWDRGSYCYTIIPEYLYCSTPTNGRTCFNTADVWELHGRCLPGCSVVGSCTGLIANAHFTANATVLTDPSTCPWECNTGYYLYKSACLPIANIIVQGSCVKESFCTQMLFPPDETYQCTGNTFTFDQTHYTEDACTLLQPRSIYGAGMIQPTQTYGSNTIEVSNTSATSVVIYLTGKIRPSNIADVGFVLGTSIEVYNFGTYVMVSDDFYFLSVDLSVDQYVYINQTFEVPVNKFYIQFQGGVDVIDPQEFFNVSYYWKFPCSYCPANQYCSNCNSTNQGVCVACPSNGISPAGSVGVDKCIPQCYNGFSRQGTNCVRCNNL